MTKMTWCQIARASSSNTILSKWSMASMHSDICNICVQIHNVWNVSRYILNCFSFFPQIQRHWLQIEWEKWKKNSNWFPFSLNVCFIFVCNLFQVFGMSLVHIWHGWTGLNSVKLFHYSNEIFFLFIYAIVWLIHCFHLIVRKKTN